MFRERADQSAIGILIKLGFRKTGVACNNKGQKNY
jgi:hypothetical protein